MQARRQLLMWALVILVLNLVLWDRLRDNSVNVDAFDGEAQPDMAQIDLTSLFESNAFTSYMNFSEELPYKRRFSEVTTEKSRAQPESSSLYRSISDVSMNVYYAREHDTLWEISRAHNLDLYTLLSINKLENPNLIRPGQAIKIPR